MLSQRLSQGVSRVVSRVVVKVPYLEKSFFDHVFLANQIENVFLLFNFLLLLFCLLWLMEGTWPIKTGHSPSVPTSNVILDNP